MDRIPNPQERTWIADYVRKHNLPLVNQNSAKVVPRKSFYTRYGKRALDIVLSIIAIVVTFPINLVLGVCTYFDVGRPVFFLQERPGKDGKPFTLVKFRNMRIAKDANGVDLPVSQRVTKFGTFVRTTSLDELLNFYSILKGDMSFFGPRPLAMLYMDRYSDRHMMRHAVRPGLECPNLKNKGYSVGWQDRLENDIWYVENVSFSVDCRMLLALIRMVFDRRTRKMHANKGNGDLIGYDEDGTCFGLYDIPHKYLEMLDEEKIA